VVGGWVDQAATFTPWLKVHRLDDLAKGALKVGPGEVVVCSYGLLPHHGERLAGVAWATLVIDEAQAVKNADTQRHQLVTKLRAEARLALSGTPVENHLTELWSLSEVLNPGLLGPADAFRRRFAEPIAEGDDEARDQLRGLLLPLVLRRTNSEVLPDLPPRIDITVPVQLSPEEAIAYERLRVAAVDEIAAQGADPMRVLVALTRLRQAACHPSLVDPGLAGLPSGKLDALGELLDHLVENDHRALIFSQFTAHLDRAQALLEARGLGWHRLDGSVPARERDRRVKAFQAGDGRVFLISLRAGGAGLNLTGADHVVHLDPWWNPAVEDQASDRAHRIGQTRPVTIYRLIAQGTIEDKIVRMHAEKRALADQLLAGADGAAGLGVSELVALISEGSLSAPAPAPKRRAR
jgi:SNF2 family DNA or RNA helicase